MDQCELLTKLGDNAGLEDLAVPVTLVINHLTWKSCWTLVNTNNI